MEAILDSTDSSARATSPHPATAVSVPTSTRSLWAGRTMSGLAVAFLLFDSAMKLAMVQPVIDASERMGFPIDTARPIGVILLACVAIYLVPRTAVLGAVLLTGYLGGAIASHLRLGDPLLSHTLFPFYFGVLVWGGLYLRDARVRTIVPWR
jgi:hypothetical protein